MKEEILRQSYERILKLRAVTEAERDDCPSIEAIQGLVDRSGTEEERLGLLDHVMACPFCRQEFELIRSISEARPRSPATWWLAVAASLLILVGGGLYWRASMANRSGAGDQPRGPAESPRLLSPAGEVAGVGALQFVWHAVPAARIYEFELLADNGDLIYSASTRDTTLRLPESVRLSGGADLRWWVRAEGSDGSQFRSTPLRFHLSRP